MSLLIASITPVLIFLFLIYKRDTIKEPKGLLIKSFFGGFLALVFVLIGATPLMLLSSHIFNPLLKSFYEAFFVAALPEELAKFVILYWIIWKNRNFDQYYDGIIYAVFVSLGFALVENLMYVIQGGIFVALTRGILSVPGHGFFAVIMGYYLSIAKFKKGKSKRNYFLKSMFIPVLFHGLYDFVLMYLSYKEKNDIMDVFLMFSFTLIVILLWVFGIKNIQKHVRIDKAVIVKQI